VKYENKQDVIPFHFVSFNSFPSFVCPAFAIWKNTQKNYSLVRKNMKCLSYVTLTCEIIVEISKNVKNKDRLSIESRGKC
jgi:hypothetical protein